MNSLDLIINKDFKAITKNISESEYRNELNAISRSELVHIMKSPKSFIKNLGKQKKSTKTQELGVLLHMAILEPMRFEQYIEAPDFGDLRKTENKEAKKSFEQKNIEKKLLDPVTYKKVIGMRNAILANEDAKKLLSGGIAEQTIVFSDKKSGICQKVRPDYIKNNGKILIDIKTTSDASIEEFSKEIAFHNYHFQMAMYSQGAEAFYGKKPEGVFFIVVENSNDEETGFENPEVAIYAADNTVLEIGDYEYKKALKKLSECIEKNQWPGIQKEVELISLPHWVINKPEYGDI